MFILMTRRFFVDSALASKDGEEEQSTKSCQNRCPKSLECGHRCPKICHPGDCPKPETCSQKVKLFCSCKRIKKASTIHAAYP